MEVKSTEEAFEVLYMGECCLNTYDSLNTVPFQLEILQKMHFAVMILSYQYECIVIVHIWE